MLAALSHRLRSDESGFGIIEVLVSAMLVVMVSLGVLAAVDAAGRTAATNKARSAASNLASQDQDRLRSKPITELATLNETRKPVVDRREYTVVSTGSYIIGGAGSENCASNDEAPRYLKMSSTVTWPGMTVGAVKQDSLRAIPNRSLEGSGSLAVDINRATGAGNEGTTVTITGPTTRSATTNADGCVIFGFIPTGTYTVSYNRSPFINDDNPGVTSISDTAVVAENSIASKSYLYDQPGTMNVTYQRANFGSTTTGLAQTDGTAFTVANGGWGVGNLRTFNHAELPTTNTGSVLFPFTDNYEAWAGKCLENKPSSLVGTGKVPAGGSVSVNVREFRLRIRVQRRTTSDTNATNNYGTVPNATQTTVLITPATSGCADNITKTSDGISATNTGSTGTASAAFTTWEATLPWGKYNVCVAYNQSNNQRARVTASNVSNETATGSTHPSTSTQLVIPYNQSSNYTC